MTTAERLETRGRAAILVRLLTLRFGELPDRTTTAIHNATPEQLLRWTDRILTATTLDEVFTEGS